MHNLLLIVQIVVSISLAGLILLQVKGTGFGRVWGGLSTSPTRRGLEGLIFKITFVLAGLFLAISVVSILI